MLLDGRPREEIVGRSHWEVYPGTEQSELGRLLKKAMADRAPVCPWKADTRRNRKCGRWLEMRADPIADAALWHDGPPEPLPQRLLELLVSREG